METNTPNISSLSTCDSILKHIINCANAALQSEDAFQKAMLGLAAELRRVFDSEYCSIGIVDGDFAEECMISYEKFEDEELSKQQDRFLNSVYRASLDDDKYIVCKALKSNEDIFFPQEKINQFNNNKYYQSILTSGHVINSYVIPLRDKEKKSFGFIQFINAKKGIDYERDITLYSDALLGLVQIIINNKKKQQELVKKENLLKDADFYNLMQKKRNSVNTLLDSIMTYFSKEFNVAVISFRMPVLNGYRREPLFYLRRVFIHPSIGESIRDKLILHYNTERLVKSKDVMNIVDELRCESQGKILENESDTNFSQLGYDMESKTLIIPIFHDFEQKCIHPQRIGFEYCKNDEHRDCKYRFKRLYGIFRLRFSKTALTNNSVMYHFDSEETKERLGYLSKQISLLLNSIVDKHENESLQVFQNELKNSSFIKIKDFDERCVDIIKKSVHAKVCSIYRYDERTKVLSLNATTAKMIHFTQMNDDLETSTVINYCYLHIKSKNNVLTRVFERKETEYILNMQDRSIHDSHFIEYVENENKVNSQSAMVVPMLKKDGSCAGIVLLIGKEEHNLSISNAYWEQDINHIEFIVNILTRISESDTERLTFLSQLSHELLAPVTEQVYDNDLTLTIAKKRSNYSRQQLLSKLSENIDRNMLFKYIVSDTEFIYSASEKNIKYNIVKQDNPQKILTDAIHLLEKEANFKGLIINKKISRMPPLYFDKERMMQVFLNLLKNAIRYSDSSTEINIYYKNENDNFHEIRFENFGIGIKESEKEAIFELFHRGEEAKKKVIRGTGMGLYIIRDIMRAHGGDCYVRQLNNPTEFVITLPKDNN